MPRRRERRITAGEELRQGRRHVNQQALRPARLSGWMWSSYGGVELSSSRTCGGDDVVSGRDVASAGGRDVVSGGGRVEVSGGAEWVGVSVWKE